MIMLADRYAAAKAALDKAEAEITAIKKEVEATGLPLIEGVTCDLKVALVGQMRVDQKLIDPAILAAAKREVVFTTIRAVAKGVMAA
jgi:hypothetical protein